MRTHDYLIKWGFEHDRKGYYYLEKGNISILVDTDEQGIINVDFCINNSVANVKNGSNLLSILSLIHQFDLNHEQ